MGSVASIDQNIDIVYPYVGQWGWATLTTANTAKDGTGTTSTIFTASSNGSAVFYLQCKPLGTNVASVLRVFVNNGSASSTASNNTLFKEVSLPATTLTEVAANEEIQVYMNTSLLPSGYKINVCIGTTVAAGWQVTAVGGNN